MDTLLYYKEAKDGQILEEGITEAGSMSSFIAAGTAYATHGVNTIPFFIYYSMFGFQRIGDLIWAGGRRARARASCSAAPPAGRRWPAKACSTRTATATCSRCAVPNCRAYDPAFAYELAVIIQDGIRRMYGEQESVFYYLTVMNEQYAMPAMPEGAREGILKGMYKLQGGGESEGEAEGAAVRQRRDPERSGQGAGACCEKYGVAADVWSVTSYKELYRDGHACERWNLLHPTETPRVPYVTQCLRRRRASFVAASDYLKSPAGHRSTAGCRAACARSAPTASAAAKTARRCATSSRSTRGSSPSRRWPSCSSEGQIDAKVVAQAIKDLGIDPEKPNPARCQVEPRMRTDAEFKLPELGENVERAMSRACWSARRHDRQVDQPVLELETDKATIEVPSSIAGVSRRSRSRPATR